MMDASITRSHEVPSASDLRDAYELELRCPTGEPVRLGELIFDRGNDITTVIIFIRHFFCAYDQEYVRSISHRLADSMLETLPSSTTTGTGPSQLIIIGCGDPALITPYIAETSTHFPIYSDPSGQLYESLHMTRTCENITHQPSYSTVGFWRGLGKTLREMARAGWVGLRGGYWGQNGGEWVFRNGRCVYVHRMRDPADHLTARELLTVLRGEKGVAKPEDV